MTRENPDDKIVRGIGYVAITLFVLFIYIIPGLLGTLRFWLSLIGD